MAAVEEQVNQENPAPHPDRFNEKIFSTAPRQKLSTDNNDALTMTEYFWQRLLSGEFDRRFSMAPRQKLSTLMP